MTILPKNGSTYEMKLNPAICAKRTQRRFGSFTRKLLLFTGPNHHSPPRPPQFFSRSSLVEESSTGSEHMQDSHISRLMRTAQPELLGRFDTMLDLIVKLPSASRTEA